MYIEFHNVSKVIKGSTVLDGIDILFESGKVYGMRGKNGSGKTMLMRAICGFILPTSGTIDINGEILGKDITFPRSIGALIENPSFIDGDTGFQNLKVLASIQNTIEKRQIRYAMESVGLDPDDTRKYRKYSLGMKQKLGIACAVMENPDIILLDEPINAIDEKGVQQVQAIIQRAKDRGALVLVACHDRDELEFLSDEIYEIESGKIVGHEVLNKTRAEE
ncbi:MAG: ABC transporter ATP-binding protein [Oscillospiraceae bacterium]|jgi:ABC-2 type transport system ATP-binding protein|nr:ABC transporter ATP-binding protein [Oscillospiraceae bacterium]